MAKGLESLEEIRSEYIYYKFSDCEDSPSPKEISWFDAIEKELKVLEIIKKKKVNVFILLYVNNLEEYNSTVGFYFSKNQLTQEEFDLLKEVLK